MVISNKPRPSHMLSKCSPTELHLQSYLYVFWDRVSLHCSSRPLAPWVAGVTGIHHHTWLSNTFWKYSVQHNYSCTKQIISLPLEQQTKSRRNGFHISPSEMTAEHLCLQQIHGCYLMGAAQKTTETGCVCPSMMGVCPSQMWGREGPLVVSTLGVTRLWPSLRKRKKTVAFRGNESIRGARGTSGAVGDSNMPSSELVTFHFWLVSINWRRQPRRE